MAKTETSLKQDPCKNPTKRRFRKILTTPRRTCKPEQQVIKMYLLTTRENIWATPG